MLHHHREVANNAMHNADLQQQKASVSFHFSKTDPPICILRTWQRSHQKLKQEFSSRSKVPAQGVSQSIHLQADCRNHQYQDLTWTAIGTKTLPQGVYMPAGTSTSQLMLLPAAFIKLPM